MTYSAADVQMVEGHIIQGERHIVSQQKLIDRLRTRGLPTAEAERLLSEFRETLEQHWQHRAAMLEAIRLSGKPL
jgi:molecular chaperone DnaK (HSP70)